MENEKGEPARLALSTQAWSERLPRTLQDAKRLAGKGSKLLEQYHKSKGDSRTKTS